MDVLEFAKRIGKAKYIPRTGWVRENIPNPESVAGHSFRTGMLAMVLAGKLNCNQEKLIKMALIHDIAEVELGDWVAERGSIVDTKSKEEKEKTELVIITELFKKFGEEYRLLFSELIERKTNESLLCWQLDKLEMAIQALEYEKEYKKDLSEFFENAKLYIKDALLVTLLQEIELKRPKKI